MNKLNKLLEKNYNFKINKYKYFPKTTIELEKIINSLIKKYGNSVDLNNINVLNIKDFSYIFSNKNFYGNVSEWDTSNGTNFESVFFECINFNSNLNNWDVSNGNTFYSMFCNCEKFNSNLYNWDISNGRYFGYMFYYCKSFNADLSKWNTKSAKTWKWFCENSLLENYQERIPERFKNN